MRHQQKRHKLGRTKSHRKATLAALGNSLIEHKRITTTVAKAKALRGFIEPLITRAKDDTSHNRRQVFRHLQDKHAVTTLFTDVSEQVGDRPGGYTRVIKLGRRAGDGAPMAMIELVDYNDVQPEGGGGGRKRTRRGGGRGRRRSKSKGAETRAQQPTEAKEETTKQVETKSKGTETETVEAPVDEAQETPITERTEAGDVPDEQVEAAKEAVGEQKEKTEAAEEAESGEEQKKAEAASEAEEEAESDKEQKKAEAEEEAESDEEEDEEEK